MKERNIKIIIVSIILICVAGIVIPIFLDVFIFGNNCPSNLTNSDWSGFLGGIWGGIIGGIGTLIAVCVTTIDTRMVQNDSKELSNIAISKDKLENIINSLSSYWEKIHKLQKIINIASEINETIINEEAEISSIKNDLLSELPDDSKKTLIENLEKKQDLLLTKKCEFNNIKNTINEIINSTEYESLLIKLLIMDNELSKELLEFFKKMQNYFKLVQEDNDFSTKKFECYIEQFLTYSKNFIKNFEEEFINKANKK